MGVFFEHFVKNRADFILRQYRKMIVRQLRRQIFLSTHYACGKTLPKNDDGRLAPDLGAASA